MEKTMIWFTSDLHISHKNVIPYCNRPYQSIEEMNDSIVRQWNSQVGPNDIVYVLGDFSLNPKWSGLILPQLNGKAKHLICGNHDGPFYQLIGKSHKKIVEKYLVHGWTDVCLQKTLLLKNNNTVLLSHLPYNNGSGNEYDERYKEYKPIDNGLVLLHGHLHSRYRKYKNMIDVGWDGDLKLWSEDEVIDFINDPREFIPTPITEFYKTRNNSVD